MRKRTTTKHFKKHLGHFQLKHMDYLTMLGLVIKMLRLDTLDLIIKIGK